MPFVTRCTFCRVPIKVPDAALGISLQCPRCANSFTVAPTMDPPAASASRSANGRHSVGVAAPAAPPMSSAADAATAVGSGPHVPIGTSVPTHPPRILAAAPIALPPGPVVVRVPDFPDTDDEQAPQRRRKINILGLAALQLGGLALIFASLPKLAGWTLPLAGMGVVLGIAGFVMALAANRSRLLPSTGIAISFVTGVLSLVWPSLFRPGGNDRLGFTGQIRPVPLKVTPNLDSLRDSSGWIDAKVGAVMQDNLRLQIDGVEVNTLKPKTPNSSTPLPAALRDRYLLIHVRTVNDRPRDVVVYKTWGGVAKDEHPPTLTDQTGRRYKQPTLDREVGISGRILTPVQLPPGGNVEEVLIFEKPTGQVDYLHLELPAEAVGGEGVYRLRIPGSMLRSSK